MNSTPIQQPYIKLDQFLKWQGITQTGGEAKLLIQDRQVFVNGTLETRRGRKLIAGDRVTVGARTYPVQL
ncbi:MAG: RNA-binding S4 domain-containing protein [Chloroflexaceae bacterium]|nr:RNA-binding S4 domain-containing protein [Chloroflexaceae bacterium]